MAEEIDFENGHFSNFGSSVTLTLTLDGQKNYIVVYGSSTSIHTTTYHISPTSLIVDVRTYVRSAVRPTVIGQQS